MLNELTTAFNHAITVLQANLPHLLWFIGLLWVIHVVNWLLSYRLNVLGLYPRSPFGLIGIVTAPFLHANFNHLFFNTIPLFVLAGFVFMSGLATFVFISVFIVIVSGLLLWLLGRSGFHLGSSGLIMGYWGYLLLIAIRQSSALAVILAIISVYYFGGLLAGLLPGKVRESWEGHVFGFLAGVAAAYVMLRGGLVYLKQYVPVT